MLTLQLLISSSEICKLTKHLIFSIAARQTNWLLARLCPEKFVFQNIAVYFGSDYLCSAENESILFPRVGILNLIVWDWFVLEISFFPCTVLL